MVYCSLNALEESLKNRPKLGRLSEVQLPTEIQAEADCPEFPVDKLPNVLINVIDYVHQEIQAPRSLIATSVLSVMSFACQDLFDISPMAQLRYPLVLYLILLAVSGERKSTVDECLMKSIRELENQLEQHYQEAKDRYDRELPLWRTEYKELEKAFGRAVRHGEPHGPSKRALEECLARKPMEPLRQRLTIDDSTCAAAKQILGKGAPSLMLLSDEAGSILNGELFRNTPFLNNSWGGRGSDVDRASSASYRIEDPRFGFSLMVQPIMLKKYFKHGGELARGSGFFARTLMCQPRSTMGTRFLASRSQTVSSEHLEWFHSRVAELLRQYLQRQESKVERTCLTLSAEARKSWETEFNRIEQEVGPAGALFEYRDWASKQLEHVARIAGILEVFVTGKTVVSHDTMDAAIHIANYFRSSFIKIMEESAMSEEIEDEMKLKKWINDNRHRFNYGMMQKNYIRRNGPNSLRNKERLDRALYNLEGKGDVSIKKICKTTYISYHSYNRYR